MTAFGIGTKSTGGPYDWPLLSAQVTNFFSSGALPVFNGMITHVNVQIG